MYPKSTKFVLGGMTPHLWAFMFELEVRPQQLTVLKQETGVVKGDFESFPGL